MHRRRHEKFRVERRLAWAQADEAIAQKDGSGVATRAAASALGRRCLASAKPPFYVSGERDKRSGGEICEDKD